MSGRGQAAAAAILVAAIAFLFAGLDRLGPVAPSAPASAPTRSAVWLCPHGGGERWSGTIALANPGDQPVDARISSISAAGSEVLPLVTVPPGEELLQDVPDGSRERATYVESFGGWIAVGWIVRAAEPEIGVGAEPCAPAASDTWLVSGATTEQGQDAFLIVMNPFAIDAVFDVSLFSADRPPVREKRLTGLVLPAHRSTAVKLDPFVEGEAALGAEIVVRVGRVAASSLGIGRRGGVRSTLGVTAPSDRWYLPTAGGSAQSALSLFAPGSQEVRFGAELRSRREIQPAGDLSAVEQAASSARVYPVQTAGPTSLELITQDAAGVVAALRTVGQSDDDAATVGLVTAARSWVVLPSVAGLPAQPGFVLVNPGSDAVTATLRLLPPARSRGPGEDAPNDVEIVIPAQAAVGAPRGLFESDPAAAVSVTTTSGGIVAVGASTSLGILGLSLYGLSSGVPAPSG